MSKILIIDEKKNAVVIEVNQQILKGLGIKQEDVKSHKSKHQLFKSVSLFIEKLQI